MKNITFQKEPIDTSELMSGTGTDGDGSVILFIGRARNRSRGKDVTHLDYEIYESMAYKEMDRIVTYAIKEWSLNSCTVIHRYGKVEIGEDSIVIALSSPHRKESYKASQYIIDTIKKTVPVWKKEFYADGSSWITDRS